MRSSLKHSCACGSQHDWLSEACLGTLRGRAFLEHAGQSSDQSRRKQKTHLIIQRRPLHHSPVIIHHSPSLRLPNALTAFHHSPLTSHLSHLACHLAPRTSHLSRHSPNSSCQRLPHLLARECFPPPSTVHPTCCQHPALIAAD